MRVSGESLALTAICLADLGSTIFLVNYRQASEGNPLMAYYLNHGLGQFVVAKLILFILPLFILEYARRRHPRIARIGLRFAIAAYLFAYVGGVAQLNASGAFASRLGRSGTPTTMASMPILSDHHHVPGGN